MEQDRTKILLIEDNPKDVRLVKELLKKSKGLNFEIAHVDRLSKSLNLLSSQEFHIVILDLSLPDCIGLETFKKIREHSPTIPIIVLMGSHLHCTDITQSRDGAQNYLIKEEIDSSLLTNSILAAINNYNIFKKLSTHFVVA